LLDSLLRGFLFNAGIGGVFKPITEPAEDEWDDVMNINLKGVWFCLKHQIPAMMDLAEEHR
jgi:NAD(P)-dependent dehydrogenase (short-subunit alcohol dehydrogenase family)